MNLQIITYYHYHFRIIVWVEETVLVEVVIEQWLLFRGSSEPYFSWFVYFLCYGNAIFLWKSFCKNQDPLLSKWITQKTGQCPN